MIVTLQLLNERLLVKLEGQETAVEIITGPTRDKTIPGRTLEVSLVTPAETRVLFHREVQ
jgi:hypothetical protein